MNPTASATPSASSSGAVTSRPSVTPSVLPSPTPEPTPDAGDAFAFYEVSVAPLAYAIFSLDGAGIVSDRRDVSFANWSFARAEPVDGANGEIYWITREGDLEGYGYRYPLSGDFRVRAVFLAEDGTRRSFYLEEDELTVLPEATPAPIP